MSKQAIDRAKQASKTVVLISAEYYKDTPSENLISTFDLESTLIMERFTFSKALGVYKGVSEKSFLVVIQNAGELSSIKWIAKGFRQESILIRAGKSIDLHYMNGDIEQLGTRFIQVNPAYAKRQDAYTIVGDCYYVVK